MEPTNQLITIAGFTSVVPSAIQSALERRDELLALARKGTCVKTADSAQRAGQLLKEIKAFTRQIEASRVEATAPVLTLQRDIKRIADEITIALETEEKRIGGLIAQFQAEQRAAEERARREAFAEQERIRKEAEAKALAAQEAAEAEARKVREAQEAAAKAAAEATARAAQEAADLEAKASRARSAERTAQLQAEAEAKRVAAAEAEKVAAASRAEAAAKAEADRAAAAAKAAQDVAEAQKAIAAQTTAVSLAAAPKLEGLSLRYDTKFEVTDVFALFEAMPAMVILTPNNAALKAMLKTIPDGQSIPGVRHWKEPKTSVR